jgi:2-desacetyl-2-hydroxyethyl bacteriochlorophyllide A dehydrogenase
MPQASVLIRAFNEQKHLGSLLSALDQQSFKDFEIVLVDSGSTDRTLEIARARCDQVIEIASRDFTFGYSLNVGYRHCKGDIIVNVSAHAVPVNGEWLGSLIAKFQDPNVAMAYGRQIGVDATKFSEQRDFERIFGAEKATVVAPYGNNANAAIRRSLWLDEPWGEHLTGLEDIAWAKVMAVRGHSVVYVPEAGVYHIHEETWHQVYNRYRREALAARTIGLTEPPHASRSIIWFAANVLMDCAAAVRIGDYRLGEIARFRYHQWRGSVDGWRRDIDLAKERNDLFYSGANPAIKITGKHHAEFVDAPIPEVKPGDVLVKVAYVGVCRTDLEIFDGHLGYYRDGIANYPIVPGHEFSGEVVRVGWNVTKVAVGDRIVGECILPCGKCEPCQQGARDACESRREVGVMNCNGAYARFVVLPADHVHRIPDTLDYKVACLTEPLAVVGKAIRRIPPKLNGSATASAVIGAGPIGNLCAQVLLKFGYKVCVYDQNPQRLECFPDSVERRQELEDLNQFSVIVEATGNVDVLKRVLAQSRVSAVIVLLGFPYGEFAYDFEKIVANDKIIIGSVGSDSTDFRWALEHLAGIDSLNFTHTVFPLRDFREAWDVHRTGKHLKVLLDVANGC